MRHVKVLIIGASGLVGSHLFQAFRADPENHVVGTFRNHPVPTFQPLETNDHAAVRRFVTAETRNWVLVPAAWSYVDGCEQDPAKARRENVDNLGNAIEAATAAGASSVMFSTDYVFDGQRGPYRETDLPSPINAYGRTKLDGERLVLRAGGLVVRTTVVYDTQPPFSKNFLNQLRAKVAAGEPMKVPMDQFGNPTPAALLAQATLRLCERGERGIFHVAGRDVVARTEFALAACREFQLDEAHVIPTETASLMQPAPRPLKSGLLVEKTESAVGFPMWGMEEGLRRVRLGQHLANPPS